MKKLVSMALLAAIAAPVFAQDAQIGGDAPAAPRGDRRADSWPAFFAICEFPAATDVAGIRVTIPYSTRHVNVTGIDIGFWGKAQYFEGIQANIIRNDAKDSIAGFQCGIYNTAGSGNLAGIQAGLWNEANSMCGVQAGLVNVCGETEGLQVGVINRSDTMHGYQIGLINIIREAELRFFPIVNIGF